MAGIDRKSSSQEGEDADYQDDWNQYFEESFFARASEPGKNVLGSK